MISSGWAFENQVSHVIRVWNCDLHVPWHTCCSLTSNVANMLTCSIIGMDIVYCNTVQFNCERGNISKLEQRHRTTFLILSVTSAYFALSTSCWLWCIDDLLGELHWLPNWLPVPSHMTSVLTSCTTRPTGCISLSTCHLTSAILATVTA